MNIVIAHFGTNWVHMSGGVEKVTCNLANELARRGHKVTILYRDKREGPPYFPLNNDVKQYNILFKNGRKIIQQKLPVTIRAVREIVRIFSQSRAQGINAKYKGKSYGPAIKYWLNRLQPDIIISCSIPSAKYVLVDADSHVPVVEMVHSHPSVQFPVLSDAEKTAVKKCKAVQILLPSGLKIAKGYFPDVPIQVIGNPVFPPPRMACPGQMKDEYIISCVASISGTKRQLLLCKAFSKLTKDYPNWKVEFWGTSNNHYAKHMEEWIKQNNLEDKLEVKGKTDHVEKVYERSDIFCLPSRGEGFALAMAEAMSTGVPAVGFKSCTGVADLIQNGKSGILVDENIESLTRALKFLMDHPEKREEFGKNAAEEMKQFNPSVIWNKWETLLSDVVQGRIK